MKRTFKYILFVVLVSGSLVAFGQKQKKRPPKSENSQTPESAKKADAANRAQKEAEYKQRLEYHQELQDKGTQKRMKKNYKKAQKQSVGKEAPFYKRWFRRRRV